jgi:hypothetical protein
MAEFRPIWNENHAEEIKAERKEDPEWIKIKQSQNR